MSKEDVSQFLKKSGFEEYVSAFDKMEVDGETLLKLTQTEDDFFLKKYLIESPEDRLRICETVHQFTSSNSTE